MGATNSREREREREREKSREDPRKVRVRETIELNGRRSNFVAPPHSASLFTQIRNSYYLVPPKANRLDHLPLVRSLIKRNGTADAARLCAKYAFPVHSPGLKAWVAEQVDYVESILSPRDKTILRSYTKYGDALVNNYSRGTLRPIDVLLTYKLEYLGFLGFYIYDQYDVLATQMVLPPRESILIAPGNKVNPNTFRMLVDDNIAFLREPANLAPLLAAYRRDLLRIILGAPRLAAPLVVYRGFKDESHLRGIKLVNRDFVSTSVSLDVGIAFARYNDKFYEGAPEGEGSAERGKYYGGVYEITVTPEIPCVYLESISKCSGEFEVLLPPGLQFVFDTRIYYKIVPALEGALLANSEREDRVAIIHVAVNPAQDRGSSRRSRKTKSKKSSRK